MPKYPFIHCLKHYLLSATLTLAGSWVFAQAQAAPLSEPPAIAVLSTQALVTSTQTTLQSLQTVPNNQWQTFDPENTYPISKSTALWVKLQLSVSAPPNGWVIRAPKPLLDRLELHWLNVSGTWSMQATGETFAHDQWPLQGLHPSFSVSNLATGEQTIFIKINGSVPANVKILVMNERDAHADALDHALRSGLIIIFLVCMAFLSACLSLVYRDKAYAWYSVYALLCAIASLAYTGAGHYLLWPTASYWSERSVPCLILAALMAQTVFCYVTFEPQKLWTKHTQAAAFSLGITTICIGLLALENIQIRVISFFVALALNWTVIIGMVFSRLRKGELSAKLWILAYLPLALMLVLQTVDNLGVSSRSITGYYWGMYCLVFEVPVLLLALMLRAKARDAHRVVHYARQQLDPLTGFVLPRAYQDVVRPLWEHAGSLEANLVVVYVQVTQPTRPSNLLGGGSQAFGSERIVRVLRTVFRQEDIFAQLKDDVYAVLMPGKTLGEPLQNRLTRLVAQMHMLSRELKIEYPLRTRISACTSQSLPMPWPDVHRILLEKFDDEKNWDKSTIRIVSKRHSQRGDDTDLSNFWARAVEVEANANRTSAP